jgi:recombination protein RecT
MSTALDQRQPPTDLEVLRARINSEEVSEEIAAALPANVSIAKFKRVTLTALNETPALVGADRPSLFAAIVKCAQDGLLPDGREAALVIFNGKAQYMPMIGGYRKIAAEHGWTLRAAVVYENDLFEHEEGFEPKLRHVRARLGEERGRMIGAYAVARHEDGRQETVVLDAAEVEKIRQVSRSKNRGPWVDWTDRMWEKTAGRKLFKQLPLGDTDLDRVRRILAADTPDPVAALYGAAAAPRAALDAAPIESAGTPPAPEPADPSPAGAPQQAGPAPTPAGPATPPPPDEEDAVLADERPMFDGEEPETSQFVPPAGATGQGPAGDLLGAVEFPSGKHTGRTFTEIAADGPDGLQYLGWAAKSWRDADFAAKLNAFLAGYVG